MARVTIISLCGLPGSGKTTLAKDLTSNRQITKSTTKEEQIEEENKNCDKNTNQEIIYWRITADEVMENLHQLNTVPSENQNQSNSFLSSTWKDKRQVILRNMDSLLEELCKQPASQNNLVTILSTFSFLVDVEQVSNQLKDLTAQSDPAHVIILDDNSYYQSMRDEVFRLARKHETGFLQVLCKCSVSTCLDRVHKRNSLLSTSLFPVTPEIIQAMDAKFDYPTQFISTFEEFAKNCTTRNWESNFLEILLNDFENMEPKRKLLLQFITYSLDFPVTVVFENTADVLKSQEETINSFLHQLELALRKRVSEIMTTSAFTENKPVVAKKISNFKQVFYGETSKAFKENKHNTGKRLIEENESSLVDEFCNQFASQALELISKKE